MPVPANITRAVDECVRGRHIAAALGPLIAGDDSMGLRARFAPLAADLLVALDEHRADVVARLRSFGIPSNPPGRSEPEP
jgi:hypothetical protein